MADLRFENPETPEDFCSALGKFNVVLPLEPSIDELGVLVDANGEPVVTVVFNWERDEVEVLGIVAHLCMAINNAGGFRAVAAVIDGDDTETAGAA